MAGGARSKLVIAAAVAVLIAVLVSTAAVNSSATGTRPATTSSPTLVRAAAPTGLNFDYVVIILMENHNLCDILTSCGGGAPYLSGLASTYAIPMDDHYCNVNPSLPNYLCLSGASDFGCSGYDGGPHSNTCTNAAWVSPNIVDRLESGGVTWKAYMEDMPSNCDSSGSGLYAVRHDPFVYYNDIAGNATRCARVIPAGPTSGSDATFLSDLGSTSTASNYMWLTPNTCNDMHDCNVTVGDTYMSNLVPQILSSTVFTTQRAAIFITFDEGYGPPTFALWAGPVVKKAYSSNVSYTHFSFLSTLESNWNLPYLNATNDGSATNMNEFFTSAVPVPSASFTFSPTSPYVGDTVTFTASASGGTSPYTYAWAFGDGATGTGASVTHAYASAGTFAVNLTVADAAAQTATALHSVVVSALPAGPVARFTYSPTYAKVNASILFDASSSLDPNGSLQYRWDWTHDGVWDTNYSTAPTASHAYATDGTYTVGLEVVDTGGLTANATQTVIADGTPPTTTASLSGTSGNGGWYRSSVQVTLAAADTLSGVASTSYRLDGGSWTPYSGAVTVSAQGSHTMDYNSTDHSGNAESTQSTQIKIDSTAPATTVALQGTLMNGGYYDGTVNVTFTATDATSGVASTQYSLDGGAWSTYSAPVAVSGNGTHALDYHSTDNAGNTESTHTVPISIGASSVAPPVTAIVTGQVGTGGWYVSNVTVVLSTTAIPGVSIRLQVDNQSWTTYTQPIPLSDGVHAVRYYSLQTSGANGTEATTSVKVDTTPPEFTASSPSGTVGTSEVSVSWACKDTVSGLVRALVSIDGAPFELVLSNPIQTQMGDGDHTVIVKAVDAAGNVATRTIAFRVDTNVFSPSGPLSGAPTYLLIELAAGVGVVLYLRHRKKVREARSASKRNR